MEAHLDHRAGAMRSPWLPILCCCASSLVTAHAGVVPQVATPSMTAEEFREHVLLSRRGRPVVVMFMTKGCPMCRSLTPFYHVLAEKYSGQVAFFEFDVGVNHHISELQDVRQLPTFQYFVGGSLVRQVGQKGAPNPDGPQMDEALKRTVEEAEVTVLAAPALSDVSNSGATVAVADSAVAGMTPTQFHDRLILGAEQRPVVVMFVSSYDCPLCERMQPALQQLASQHDQKAKFHLWDVSVNADIMAHQNVSQIPMVQVFLMGRKVHEVGALGNDLLEERSLAEVVKQSIGEAETVALLGYQPPLHAAGEEASAQGKAGAQEGREQTPRASPCTAARRGKDASSPRGVEKLVVLGGGPAGLSAGIYAARAALCPLLIFPRSGGQLESKGAEVENYPGISRRSGEGIIDLMGQQARSFDAEVLSDRVASVDFSVRPFIVHTNASGEVRAEAVIIATGASSLWLGVEGESEYHGAGVSNCAICDGYTFYGKRCVVVGGGDSAAEDALLLSRICSEVTVVHRRDTLRAGPVLAGRVLSNPKIHMMWEAEVSAFRGDKPKAQGGGLTHIMVRSHKWDGLREVAVDGAFVAIGHAPNTALFKGQVEMDERTGHIQLLGRSTHTSVPGVFAAGDVSDVVYRQAVTSAGIGAAAAIDADRWLTADQAGNAPDTLSDSAGLELIRGSADVRQASSSSATLGQPYLLRMCAILVALAATWRVGLRYSTQLRRRCLPAWAQRRELPHFGHKCAVQ